MCSGDCCHLGSTRMTQLEAAHEAVRHLCRYSMVASSRSLYWRLLGIQSWQIWLLVHNMSPGMHGTRLLCSLDTHCNLVLMHMHSELICERHLP